MQSLLGMGYDLGHVVRVPPREAIERAPCIAFGRSKLARVATKAALDLVELSPPPACFAFKIRTVRNSLALCARDPVGARNANSSAKQKAHSAWA